MRVLANSFSANLRGGQDQDGACVLLERSIDSGNGASLGGRHRDGGETSELVESADVWDSNLCNQASLVHHGDGLLWIVTLGGFTGQHDTVSTVQDGVTNIADFSTSWTWVVGHGLEHLCGANDGLASDVALGDHHLLSDEDLGRWNFDTKISTGDHDTISLLEDLVEVVHTLLVLNLGNDLDVLAILAENLADGGDVASTTDERSEDHVDSIFDTESQIVLVLLGESWQIDVGLGQVDTLTGGNLAVVDGAALEVLLVNDIKDLECEDTVIYVDGTALLDHLGDVLVVDIPIGAPGQHTVSLSPSTDCLHGLVVALGSIRIVGGDGDLVTGTDGQIRISDGVSSTDLRTFLQRL